MCVCRGGGGGGALMVKRKNKKTLGGRGLKGTVD